MRNREVRIFPLNFKTQKAATIKKLAHKKGVEFYAVSLQPPTLKRDRQCKQKRQFLYATHRHGEMR